MKIFFDDLKLLLTFKLRGDQKRLRNKTFHEVRLYSLEIGSIKDCIIHLDNRSFYDFFFFLFIFFFLDSLFLFYLSLNFNIFFFLFFVLYILLNIFLFFQFGEFRFLNLYSFLPSSYFPFHISMQEIHLIKLANLKIIFLTELLNG